MPEIENYETKYIDIPFDIKADSIQEDGTFEGYASVFGGRPDSYGDIIAAGAFGETIKKGGRNKNGIAMLWYHDVRQPIGIWKSIVQDEKGLKVIGQLNLDVQRAKEIHSLMRQGAVKGLSIGWDFMKDSKGKVLLDSFEWKDEANMVRLLKNVELWEISPVTFPAKVNANITKVKAIDKAKTERELENALRESGLSKADAQYVVKLSKPSLRESEEKEEENVNLESKKDDSNKTEKKDNYPGEKHEDDSELKEALELKQKSTKDYNEILSKLRKVNTEMKVHTLCS